MIFSTSSCPSLIPLSPFPASIPDAGLLPATLLADEDLVCPVSHSSYRSPGFFFSIKKPLCSSMDTSMCCPQGPQPFPPPQGINPTHCRKNPPERNGLVFPYFHGAPFPKKRAQCWPRAGSRRCVSRPRAVPAPRARGRDLAPRTALPEPAAPRGKRLLPGLAPASPKIQLNGTGFSTNLSGRIQPRGAGARPCAAFGACWKLGARDIPCEPQILAQPWHRGPQHVPWGWGGVPAHHLPVGNAQVGLPCLFDPKPVFFSGGVFSN